jgi:hypothetical protein
MCDICRYGGVVRIYKNRWFERFARKEKIEDAALCEAVSRAVKGLIDADLGGSLIKQRVARPGAGKSGGYRTLIFFRARARAVFAFGFAKSDQDNIDPRDEALLKDAAKLTLAFTQSQIDKLVKTGTLVEVNCDGKE